MCINEDFHYRSAGRSSGNWPIARDIRSSPGSFHLGKGVTGVFYH